MAGIKNKQTDNNSNKNKQKERNDERKTEETEKKEKAWWFEWMIKSLNFYAGKEIRACLHGGGVSQVGEVNRVPW